MEHHHYPRSAEGVRNDGGTIPYEWISARKHIAGTVVKWSVERAGDEDKLHVPASQVSSSLQQWLPVKWPSCLCIFLAVWL